MLRAIVICICIASAYGQIGSFNLPTMEAEATDTTRGDQPYGVPSTNTTSMDHANHTTTDMHNSTTEMRTTTDSSIMKITMAPWAANQTTEMPNATTTPAPTTAPKSSASTIFALSLLTCFSAVTLTL